MKSIRYQAATESMQAQLIPFVAVCEQAGARFVGIQEAVPECNIEAHVLFLAPSGTSMMLPLSQFSTHAVFQKVLESTARFAPKPASAIGKAA